MNSLPTEFDLIVIGTGLVESIVAAAASRIGKTVLHIDNKEFYGGSWGSFTLENIEKLKNSTSSTHNFSMELPEKISVKTNCLSLTDVDITWHTTDSHENDIKNSVDDEIAYKEPSKEELLKHSRKFNIDLVPKLHFARGKFVELLISSNIARYAEFRSVSRILTHKNDKLEIIPCSRSDIFTNTNVNVIEKRMLMKLVETCLSDDFLKEFENYSGKTFCEYLTDKKITDNLQHFIVHAIAMSGMDVNCIEGVRKVRRFMESLGRFGKTPLLYAMFGSGELPQAFCRLCAVFGGIYALNLSIESIELPQGDETFLSVKCNDQNIKGHHLVTSQEYVSSLKSDKKHRFLSRAIFITQKSILESDGEHLSLLLFPSDDGRKVCRIIEAGSQTGTTPKGFYLIYMSIEQSENPQEDLKYYVGKLFNEIGPKILWSCYYSLPLFEEYERVANNVFLASGPDTDLDYDASIIQAQKIFKEIYPQEEFLPRAPDPEEIIFGDDANEENAENTENTENTEKHL